MNQSRDPDARTDANHWRKLTKRHTFQIMARSMEEHEALCSVYSLTFRPGDHRSSFRGHAIRPCGAAVMVALGYEVDSSRRRAKHRRMPLRGFRGQANAGGFVEYGGTAGVEFDFDGARRPTCGGRGPVLDPIRNAGLLDLINQMDRQCQLAISRPRRFSSVPRLPKILLGFPPARPPAFEDTPALRRLAALELGVRQDRLGANGPELLDLLLHDVWESQLISPDNARNATGSLLVNADLVSKPVGVLKVYEDFSHLLGVRTWNPARTVAPLRLPNPAPEILARYHVATDQGFNQPLSDELIEELKRAMRATLGTAGESVSDEEVLDAVTNPDGPLVSWRSVLPKLRARLSPFFAECATDDDLLEAARDTNEPLIASGACRVQVLERRGDLGAESLHFTPEDLGRRMEVDLNARWKGERQTGRVKAEAPTVVESGLAPTQPNHPSDEPSVVVAIPADDLCSNDQPTGPAITVA